MKRWSNPAGAYAYPDPGQPQPHAVKSVTKAGITTCSAARPRKRPVSDSRCSATEQAYSLQVPQVGWAFFKKAATASGSFLGWLGRIFCRDRPFSRKIRPVDVTAYVTAHFFSTI